jgi:cytochrome c oxidase cbb3-type subunit I/II
MFIIQSNIPTIASVKPYTPLELLGRDIYLTNGCYNCHSQMIRPILAETKRYGEYSKPGESVYDHPFQWGSRRIGPDLAREGGKQSPTWHAVHFQDPRKVTPGSIMPNYAFLLESPADFDAIPRRMAGMRTLGVPYGDDDIGGAIESARRQATQIAAKIAADNGPSGLEDKEAIAIIAYLDRLGKDLFAPPPVTPATEKAKMP